MPGASVSARFDSHHRFGAAQGRLSPVPTAAYKTLIRPPKRHREILPTTGA